MCGEKKTRKGSKLYKSRQWFHLKKDGSKVPIERKMPKYFRWTRYCADCEKELRALNKELRNTYGKENSN